MMKTLNVWTMGPNEKLIGEIKCHVILDKFTCYLAVIDDIDITEYLKWFEEKNNVKLKVSNISSIKNEKLYLASVLMEDGEGLFGEVVFKYLKKDGKKLLLQEVCGNSLYVNTETKIGQMLLCSKYATLKE